MELMGSMTPPTNNQQLRYGTLALALCAASLLYTAFRSLIIISDTINGFGEISLQCHNQVGFCSLAG